jgi:hypothetical protein
MLSWHTLGILIRTGIAGMLATVVTAPLCWFLPDCTWAMLPTAICLVVDVVCTVAAVFLYLLYLVGFLKITCPLCGAKGAPVGKGYYTYLRCSQCGRVDAKGCLSVRYEVTEK